LPRGSKKRYHRELTVEAASRGVLAMCVHGFIFTEMARLLWNYKNGTGSDINKTGNVGIT
jgi:hypothetical protein